MFRGIYVYIEKYQTYHSISTAGELYLQLLEEDVILTLSTIWENAQEVIFQQDGGLVYSARDMTY